MISTSSTKRKKDVLFLYDLKFYLTNAQFIRLFHSLLKSISLSLKLNIFSKYPMLSLNSSGIYEFRKKLSRENDLVGFFLEKETFRSINQP